MRKTIVLALCLLLSYTLGAQTLNLRVGDVTYQFPASQAGNMTFTNGVTLTILDKDFTLADVDEMFIDESEVVDNRVRVVYSGTSAQVFVAGNVAAYVDATVSGAKVSIAQSLLLDANVGEITYALSGSSSDGQFVLDGEYKASVELNNLDLTNASDGPAVHILNGKRIDLTLVGTNRLSDAAGGTQKAALHIKGHTEVKGDGTLAVAGLTAHAIKGGEYFLLKKSFTGSLVVERAVSDGIHVNQYYEQRGGTVTISAVGDDGLQVELDTDSEGVVKEDAENTGELIVSDGTLTVTTTADAAKGIKADGNINIAGGSVNVTQTGSIATTTDDISYPAAIRSAADIHISGGHIVVKSTADGGRGLRADGAIVIDEEAAQTTIDITANGSGGVAENVSSSSGSTEPAKSYRVYVSLPSSSYGGGFGGPGSSSSAWSKVYLCQSDGTQVAQLTSTVSKSSGYSTTTFYYYDFGEATTGTYYFKSDNSSSRGTSYAIRSASFAAPTSGEDVYYAISSSYTTSGSTRTYSLSNVTSTYGGTSDLSEDNGTGYNAAAIKATGDVTLAAGTVTLQHSGTMSKGIKSKGTTTVSGGTLHITSTGGMQVINSDASYCAGIKTVDFIQRGGSITLVGSTGAAIRGISATNVTTEGGTLTITNSSAGQTGSSDNYTAKGIKADTHIALLAGTINISMTGSGGKGIKSAGTYTQGVQGGDGPTLTVSTTGASFGSSTSSGNGWGGPGGWGPGGESSGGSSAKAIKVQGVATLYGGETVITTTQDGAEGLESKTTVYIEGGKHYLFCYDDCINSAGNIYFNGGVTVCYSNGNDAVDSNAGRTGAITIGDGVIFAFTSKGSPEEGLDCDNNSYIQITGNGIAISAGGAQGGGSSSSISGAAQGYYFYTSSISYTTGRYYTLADANGNNLVTYSFPVSVSSSLSLFTAKGMTSGKTFTVKYSTTAPTDATTAWHGVYLGSSHQGTTSVLSATAK